LIGDFIIGETAKNDSSLGDFPILLCHFNEARVVTEDNRLNQCIGWWMIGYNEKRPCKPPLFSTEIK